MKVLVAVPSKGRANELQKDTLSWLKKTSQDYKVFVEPQDYGAYREGMEGSDLIQLNDNNKGLGYAKKAIYEYAKANGYEAVFKVDDDVIGWYGRDRKSARENSYKVFEEAINAGTQTFEKYADVVAISYPYSFQMFEAKKWTGVNQRTQTCYLVRTDFIYPDPRISTLEDFATFIYIRVNNKITLRYGFAGIECRDIGSNSGGHQSFNRDTQVRQEIEYLRDLYPALKIKKVEGKAWQYEPDLNDKFFGGRGL